MNKYKNITAHELVVPNVGVVVAGGEIETELEVENPNLKPVKLFGKEEISTDEPQKTTKTNN